MGCSGSDEGEACDLAHREGTYLLVSKERPNGSCGPIVDQVVRVDNVGALPPGCTKDAPDDASPDRCEYSRSYTCALTDGGAVSFVGTTTEHDGGDRITGVSTMVVVDANGMFVCTSAYDLTFTRQ